MTNKYKLYTKDGRLLYFKSHQERLKFVNKEKKKELKEMNKRIPVVLKTPTHSVVSAPDHTKEEYHSLAKNGEVIIFDNEDDFNKYLAEERRLIEIHLESKKTKEIRDIESLIKSAENLEEKPSLLDCLASPGIYRGKAEEIPIEKNHTYKNRRYNVVIDKATQLYLRYEIIS